MRAFVVLLALLAFAPMRAHASVSIAVTLDRLVRATSDVALVTPKEQKSVWENGRIYTYTRVWVERQVAGPMEKGKEVWIRTMGGVVGDVGQLVDGEPTFQVGKQTLVFLHAGPIGAFEVTARAQGQYSLRPDEKKVLRLARHAAVGALVSPSPRDMQKTTQLVGDKALLPVMAREALDAKPFEEALRDIRAAFARVHPKP